MAKLINLKKKKAQHNGEYEYCVICWKKTNVKRNEPVYKRVGYYEGVGQLCDECYKRLYGKF